MIGHIRGIVLAKQPPVVVVEAGGLGYEIEAPLSVFDELPAVGASVTLFTHLAIRDDAHVLYGFTRERERALFRALLKVSGVGARLALAILSGLNAADFARCIAQEDLATLMRLPGVGRKTAQRLLVEMKDRLAAFDPSSAPLSTLADLPAPTAFADAVSALIALGYRPAEAQRLARAADPAATRAEDILRAALRAAGNDG